MDSKEVQEKVALLLADLHAKIDTIKEKVEKLCESTEECFRGEEEKDSDIRAKKSQNN
tara:strand:+ start:5200 stop:5373 length:174 start_codon:yes stop_codon:yes gene_type:complete